MPLADLQPVASDPCRDADSPPKETSPETCTRHGPLWFGTGFLVLFSSAALSMWFEMLTGSMMLGLLLAWLLLNASTLGTALLWHLRRSPEAAHGASSPGPRDGTRTGHMPRRPAVWLAAISRGQA